MTVATTGTSAVGGTSVGGTSVGGTSVGGTSVGGTSVGGTSVGGTSVGGTGVGGTGVGGTGVGGTGVGGTGVGGTGVGGTGVGGTGVGGTGVGGTGVGGTGVGGTLVADGGTLVADGGTRVFVGAFVAVGGAGVFVGRGVLVGCFVALGGTLVGCLVALGGTLVAGTGKSTTGAFVAVGGALVAATGVLVRGAAVALGRTGVALGARVGAVVALAGGGALTGLDARVAVGNVWPVAARVGDGSGTLSEIARLVGDGVALGWPGLLLSSVRRAAVAVAAALVAVAAALVALAGGSGLPCGGAAVAPLVVVAVPRGGNVGLRVPATTVRVPVLVAPGAPATAPLSGCEATASVGSAVGGRIWPSTGTRVGSKSICSSLPPGSPGLRSRSPSTSRGVLSSRAPRNTGADGPASTDGPRRLVCTTTPIARPITSSVATSTRRIQRCTSTIINHSNPARPCCCSAGAYRCDRSRAVMVCPF
jgi:hypothetical protein